MTFMTMHAAGVDQAAGYRGGRESPIGIGGAVAVHALLVGGFLLMPGDVIAPYVPPILIGRPIPLDPPPPPEAEKPQPPSRKALQPAHDPLPSKPDAAVDLTTGGGPMVLGDGGLGEGQRREGVIPPPLSAPEPVLVEAGIDPRALAAFQPDYPASMIRQGVEGTVTVRVAIGADGRVTGVERLAASDEAFWIATQRHALRKWRFRPATRDGEPVASSKVLTVHFRLADL